MWGLLFVSEAVLFRAADCERDSSRGLADFVVVT